VAAWLRDVADGLGLAAPRLVLAAELAGTAAPAAEGGGEWLGVVALPPRAGAAEVLELVAGLG
jgi:hypothetical protein